LLSISIVTYKTEIETIARLIDSLKVAIGILPTNYKVDKISFVENSSSNKITSNKFSTVLENLDQSELIFTGSNLGYGAAHNIAIHQSNSKYHLLMNPDVIVNKYCLLNGIEYLEQNKNVVALSPEVRNEQGEVQGTTKSYPSVFDLVLRGIDSNKLNKMYADRLSVYENRAIHNMKKINDVVLISGCFMFCRADILKQAGGFDKRYFLYFEDYSLSLELKKYGFLRYLPTMEIAHSGGNAAKKGLKHIFYFVSSAIKFFNQYGWKIR